MPATYDRTTPYVVYASRAGVPPIASLAAPQSGPDGTAALQAVAAMNKAGGPLAGQSLKIVIDIPVLCANVALNSFTTIEGLGGSFEFGLFEISKIAPPSGLWMRKVPTSPGTDSCILKNANWRSPYEGGLLIDQDITVRDLYLDGQRTNDANNNGSVVWANPNGQFVSPIQFFGVNHLDIENVFVYDPCSYHIHCANIFDASFRRVRVLDPVQFATPAGYSANRGTDGIHLNGPWDNVTIDDVQGTTGDDLIALNLADGNLENPGTVNVSGPGCFGGFAAVYYGSAGRTIVRNVRPFNCANVLRILLGSDPRLSGLAPTIASWLSVSEVAGSTIYGPVISQLGSALGLGTGGYVGFGLLKDWNISAVASVGSIGTAFNDAGIAVPPSTSFTISGFRFNDLIPSSLIHQIQPMGAITGALAIIDHQIYEDSSEVLLPAPMAACGVSGGVAIADLDFRGLKWSRNGNTPGSAVTISTGTVTNLQFSDTYINNINNVVAVTGGTVSDINSTGLTHIGANGNSSFALTPAIARFRAAGSNTVSLLSGTAPTSHKTDGTEDA